MAFYGTWRFVIPFTLSHNLVTGLSLEPDISSPFSQIPFLIYILMLSSHVCPSLPSGLFTEILLTQMIHAFSIPSMYATWPAHLTFWFSSFNNIWWRGKSTNLHVMQLTSAHTEQRHAHSRQKHTSPRSYEIRWPQHHLSNVDSAMRTFWSPRKRNVMKEFKRGIRFIAEAQSAAATLHCSKWCQEESYASYYWLSRHSSQTFRFNVCALN